MRKIYKIFVAVLFLMQTATLCFAADVVVTSPFGWRSDPYTGEWKFHAGVDLGYDYGTAIPAFIGGDVIQAGNFDDGYGNQILIYSPQIDVYTRYAHCSVLNVVEGDCVTEGDIIALVGSTGRSTGPHLHFEYIVDTEDGYQYADPLVLWQ